ncbi:NUDIX hydrolase [Micromonospora purpureochromogenes]|uniref:ADP-ribose pyrophosphatase YjhB (NUDIX family) n=1 Tax=Micromonospora purpureochromogenes TaxID=47872 RepID=A0ABX2RCH9_9ACTN|nr:NUDIX domain-containing protein [Micromonospora purpureochromogenes]NYF54202.1 ADP-ribose pyrophosphatase YjhB (NUDIX family) [Micromonospora purpureochromogenes]
MSTLTWAVAAVLTDEAGRVLLCRRDRGGRWALPGGRLHRPGCPTAAVAGEVLRETGCPVEIVDLVGLYHLSGSPCGGPPTPDPLPDVLVHVFRARAHRDAAETPPAGCTLSWQVPDRLPAEVTPVTRAAVADARAGRSGVLRDLRPDPATAIPTPPSRAGDPVPPAPRGASAVRPTP